MKNIILLLIVLLSTSCATMFNTRNTEVTVFSKKPVTFTVQNDTTLRQTRLKENPSVFKAIVMSEKKKAEYMIQWLQSKKAKDTTLFNYTATIYPKRSKKPLTLTVYYPDSCSYNYTVKPTTSPTTIINLYNYFLGSVLDANHAKGYTYPDIYVDRKQSKKEDAFSKGDLGIGMSIPLLNFMQGPFDTDGGVLGVGLGLNYFYSDNIYAQVKWTFDLEGLSSYDLSTQFAYSASYTITNHHCFDRIILGYGIAFTENKSASQTMIDDNQFNRYYYSRYELSRRYRSSLGLNLSSYFRITNHVAFGIVYQPTFLNLTGHKRFSYQHLISLDLAFRIPLYRKIR